MPSMKWIGLTHLPKLSNKFLSYWWTGPSNFGFKNDILYLLLILGLWEVFPVQSYPTIKSKYSFRQINYQRKCEQMDRFSAIWLNILSAIWMDRLSAIWMDRLSAIWMDRLSAIWMDRWVLYGWIDECYMDG